jgi:hypothetical protein
MQGVEASEDQQRDEEVECIIYMYCTKTMLLFYNRRHLGDRGCSRFVTMPDF